MHFNICLKKRQSTSVSWENILIEIPLIHNARNHLQKYGFCFYSYHCKTNGSYYIVLCIMLSCFLLEIKFYFLMSESIWIQVVTNKKFITFLLLETNFEINH